ncbi:GNAT family N-acetyltransferase [Neobacillus dielmonensis]|uniref:GNAT family N-acetyltransferase n=1 Tax=Neobacillus dielmonensis TaxID=1347369 RepID=UPI0005A85BF3|nr:N-acetyltransferase [Neobacillus dielmonensis]
MVKIRNVKMADLPELVVIENLCFTKEEAATKESFEQRIQMIPDSFFVAEADGGVVGLVNGPVTTANYITDDLFSQTQPNPLFGGHQSILGLAVLPSYQNQGIASALLNHLEKQANAKSRETVTLTCKQNLIQFYEKHGYVNKGVSNSEHGGGVWYNMVKKLG